MPEGVGGYPKWQGSLSAMSAAPVIAAQEIRRAWENPWARAALTLGAAYAVLFLGSLYTASQSGNPETYHTTDNFLFFLLSTGVRRLITFPYLALLVTAVMAGSLIADDRKGALELYLSRAVTRGEYLTGKILAVFGLGFATVWVPSMVYWGVSFMLFDIRPEGWLWIPAKSLVFAATWAFTVTGLGLGLAAATRSARAATLILFGAVAAVDIILSNLLEAITANDQFQVLSPLSALHQATAWLLGAELPYSFPYWWGFASLVGFSVLGWALMIWKHPRVRGVEA